LNVAVEAPSTKHWSATSKTQILRNLSDFFDCVSGLEKSHEVKDMKIKHLENEVQRYAPSKVTSASEFLSGDAILQAE